MEKHIFNFGCSSCISSISKLISTCTSVQTGIIYIGNSAPCKAIGQGTNQIHLHGESISILSYVHHVPESRFNLISLRILNSKVFTFKEENSCLEVSKGAHIKFKADKGNLYMYISDITSWILFLHYLVRCSVHIKSRQCRLGIVLMLRYSPIRYSVHLD